MSRGTYISLRIRIEQAVARGETLDEICAGLGVTSTDVDKALRRMDEAVRGDAFAGEVMG